MDEQRQAMPTGYRWVTEKGLAGFDAFTALQPWYLLKDGDLFEAAKRWPDGPSDAPLLAFARRQDNDDIACFEVKAGKPGAVVVIHGWTGGGKGYALVARYPTFWDWMKSVIHDITQWSEG